MNSKNAYLGLGMVDISSKAVTHRRAVAVSRLKMSRAAFDKLRNGKSPKGNVLETAKIAGIMAAKATPNIIPLCHPLQLSSVNLTFKLERTRNTIHVTAEVLCAGKTGVEMEALTAVSVAALTIYDMMKWADKTMVILDTFLLHKSGGKSGEYNAISSRSFRRSS